MLLLVFWTLLNVPVIGVAPVPDQVDAVGLNNRSVEVCVVHLDKKGEPMLPRVCS